MRVERLFPAGVAAAGKPPRARLYSRLYGTAWYEVEARRCWPVAGPEARQRCFLREFIRILRRGGAGAYSNHLLTVYAYSRALGVAEVAEEALEATRAQLEDHSDAGLVVLAASPEALRARIAARLAAEGERRANVVEGAIRLHLEAQRLLLEAARRLHLAVLDTTRLSPREAALALRGLALSRRVVSP